MNMKSETTLTFSHSVSPQVRQLPNLERNYFPFFPLLEYHLVVICSIENEDRSNMVASLDQNRRQFPPLPSLKGIQNYLKEQLVVSGAETVSNVQLAPAAIVDLEKWVYHATRCKNFCTLSDVSRLFFQCCFRIPLFYRISSPLIKFIYDKLGLKRKKTVYMSHFKLHSLQIIALKQLNQLNDV